MYNERLSLELYNITIQNQKLSKINEYTFDEYMKVSNSSAYLGKEVTNVILFLVEVFNLTKFDLKASIFVKERDAVEFEKLMYNINGQRPDLIYISIYDIYDINKITFYIYRLKLESKKTLIHMIMLKKEGGWYLSTSFLIYRRKLFDLLYFV